MNMLLISGCSDKCGDTKAIIQEKILTNEQLGKQTVEQVHKSWQLLQISIQTQFQIQIRNLEVSLDSDQKSGLKSRSRSEIKTEFWIWIRNIDSSPDLDQKSRHKSRSDENQIQIKSGSCAVVLRCCQFCSFSFILEFHNKPTSLQFEFWNLKNGGQLSKC